MRLWIVMLMTALIVSGCGTTKKTEQPTSESRPVKVAPSISFKSSKPRITEGDSVVLSWSVQTNDSLAPTVMLQGEQLPTKGERVVSPAYGSQRYFLSVRTSDTVIDRTIVIEVDRKPVPVWTPDDISQGNDDGRFTIGCRGQRLTYGFPAPLSTSHIIVKVNGEYASNNPSLERRTLARTFRGNAIRAGRLGYNRTEIPLRFYGVDIFQRVVPVDRNFREITDEQDAVYYKMTWTLTNRHGKSVNVGLTYLLDTMIDDNDAARIQADATHVSSETEFNGNQVPQRMLVYRRDLNEDDLTAVYLPYAGDSPKPSSVVVGRWPFLHGQVWKAAEPGESYYDSAIMTVWDDVSIEPNSSVTFVSYYGTKQAYPLVMIDNNANMKSQVVTFTYDKAETALPAEDVRRIRDLVSGKRIFAASVSGFSDAQGDDDKNLSVSKERAERIIAQLVKLGVDKRLIMLKAYGESQALQSPDAIKNGVQADRRVDVNVWYE
jgi:outer membrane protein OmpA-like peptidoglycan-associated protein